jgi:undecaprenyl diphosphate synthase
MTFRPHPAVRSPLQGSAPILLEPATDSERQLFSQLAPERLPRHVAIIMDGNGRWAKQKSLMERVEGHKAGIGSVRESVRTAAQLRLKALTLYAFSSENWSRPAHEVTALMSMLESFLIKEIPELMDNNIRLVASGDLTRLPRSVQNKLSHTMEKTAGNTGTVLNLALSYGGRQELVDACRALATKVANGELNPEQITEEALAQHLYQPELGDPELLIRTSGEQRVSNFLLWQIAYTEFVYLPVLWPDFRRQHFLEALVFYQQRDRRFGKVS